MPHIIDPIEELTESQVRSLASMIRRHEDDRIINIEFKTGFHRPQYLNECKDTYDHAIALLDDKHYLPDRRIIRAIKDDYETGSGSTNDADDDKMSKIAHDIFGYVLNGVTVALQCIASVGIRRKYLEKLKGHQHTLVVRFQNLSKMPAAHREAAARALAEEIVISKAGSLQYLRRHVSITERFVSIVRKGPGGDTFAQIVQRYQKELAKSRSPDFEWPFERLNSTQKIQVYGEMINKYGQGGPGIQRLEQVADAAGQALLLLTAGLMAWDINMSKNKVYTTVHDAVAVLTTIGSGKVIDYAAETATTSVVSTISRAAESLLGFIVPSSTVTTGTVSSGTELAIASPAAASYFTVGAVGFVCVTTVVAGVVGGLALGAFTGWLVDRFFESGGNHSASDTSKVRSLDDFNTHSFATVVADHSALARQLAANRPAKK